AVFAVLGWMNIVLVSRAVLIGVGPFLASIFVGVLFLVLYYFAFTTGRIDPAPGLLRRRYAPTITVRRGPIVLAPFQGSQPEHLQVLLRKVAAIEFDEVTGATTAKLNRVIEVIAELV